MYRFTLHHQTQGDLTLTHPPVQWDSISFEYERDKKYHGILPKIAFEADFVFEGRAFIKNAYDREGIEAIVTITVDRYNPNTFSYELAYTGRLDFTGYREELGGNGNSVSLGVEQAGYTRQFLNLDDVEVNLQSLKSQNGTAIPAFSSETTTIQLHSKEIIQRYEAYSTDAGQTEITTYESEPAQRTPVITLGFDNVLVNELDANTYTNNFDFGEKKPVIITAKVKGLHQFRLRVNGQVKVTSFAGSFDEVDLAFYFQINDNAPVQLTHNYGDNINSTYDHIFNSGDVQLDYYLNIGDQIKLYGDITVSDTSGAYRLKYQMFLYDESYFSVKVYGQTDATNARGLMIHEAFSRIVQSTSDMKAGFRSDFFGRTDSLPVTYAADGYGSLLWLSNGFQIRNFPLADRPVFSSFRSLFESLDAIYCLGAGIEIIDGQEIVRVEPREYFYKNEVSVHLGCVSKFKKTVATEFFYNQAEFGYQQWQSEQKNGLEEFNAKQTISLPITQVKNKYQATSAYIASGYILEMTRREQYTGAETKDSRMDNQNFLVCLLRNGSSLVTERNQKAVQLENVISPDTVYNLRISPARNKRRHGKWLKAGLVKRGAQSVKFNNGEGNYKVKSLLLGENGPITENENILVNSLEAAYFLPEYYELEAPFTAAQQEAFEANPYGMVAFEDGNGNTAKGYVLPLKTNPTDQMGQFTLLRALNG